MDLLEILEQSSVLYHLDLFLLMAIRFYINFVLPSILLKIGFHSSTRRKKGREKYLYVVVHFVRLSQ